MHSSLCPFLFYLGSSFLILFSMLFAGHLLGVVAVAAHPRGTIAASTSLDSFVRVFEIDSNATMTIIKTPPSEAWLIQFDPKVCVVLLK
jgi:WD40 repeat protein